MKICVTGAAGYVGSALIPSLLLRGHQVTVLDTFWFGDNLPNHDQLTRIKGDIRVKPDLRKAFSGQEVVIHLACVSNDPSFDMNPKLGRSINYDCFKGIIDVVKACEVRRFVYASSSSVYGVSDLEQVTEDSPKDPLTDYSKFKLACEAALKTYGTGGEWMILRPATVCGYAKRLRLDLVVNILTIQALAKKEITLFGTEQKRPNINILDMVRAYEWAIEANKATINEQTFNVGFQNMTLSEIGHLVMKHIRNVTLKVEPVKDPRSYHVNSDAIMDAGFKPKHTIEEAILSLKMAFNDNLMKNPLTNSMYSNIRKMKELRL